jgi:hypothetical protein
MIKLTDAERQRFADWCEQEARSTDQLLQAAQKINFAPALKMLKAEAMAYVVIAKKLRNTETMELK